jgi:hypothetical protein
VQFDVESDWTVAARLEAHEADVWVRCVRSTGPSLGAMVGNAGGLSLPVLTAVDDDAFNRVVGLGVGNTARKEQVEELVAFYRGLGQQHFRVELAPFAAPSEIPGWLRNAGMEPGQETFTMKWRDLETLVGPIDTTDVDIRVLGIGDAERVGALNVQAWGAWQAPVSLHPWFASTVGRDRFTHYGVFVDDALCGVGAMAIDGDLAWIGFDATSPRFRSRGLRRALNKRRVEDARAAGARFVHGEIRTLFYSAKRRLNLLDRQYERRLWLPVGAL